MKKNIMMLLLAASLMVGLSACGAEEKPAEPTKTESKAETENKAPEEAVAFEDTSYMVDADWLKENLDKVQILDARGVDAYGQGHIPSAIPVMWQQFSMMEGKPGESSEWGTVLQAEALSKALSAIGLSADKDIIVYAGAQKGWGEEGRIVWMLQRAGFTKAKILDGGLQYWESKGYETTKEITPLVPTEVKVAALSSETNIDTKTLKEKLDQVTIIDVREADEYAGATKYGEARGGHLPGAINIPFVDFINADGRLKTAAEIQKILDEKGIKKDAEIVTYCTAGIRSAHMQIVLEMLGYQQAKNYDDSFYAWAGNPDLPLEK